MDRDDGGERRREDRRRRTNEGRVWFVTGVVTALLAVGSFSWSATEALKNRRLISESVPVEGRVIGMAQGGDSTAAPVIRYEVDGRSYEIRARTSSRPPAYARGDPVVVRYRPGRPAEGRLDSFEELWLPALVFAGVGILLGALSAGCFLPAKMPGQPGGGPAGAEAGDRC